MTTRVPRREWKRETELCKSSVVKPQNDLFCFLGHFACLKEKKKQKVLFVKSLYSPPTTSISCFLFSRRFPNPQTRSQAPTLGIIFGLCKATKIERILIVKIVLILLLLFVESFIQVLIFCAHAWLENESKEILCPMLAPVILFEN